jgi:23S rRNA (uridine2552-2'-O)-methyltransferase
MSKNKKTTRVKTAKKRKTSSTRWLERQLNDPYVDKAKAEGYRSRAAFKILEIDEKVHILKRGMRIVDLGAAPGGWSQVAADKGCTVVAIDLLPVDDLPGVQFVQMDFMDDDAPDKLKEMLGGLADVVLSDMAPNTMGHKQTDHLRIMAVVEAAYYFAKEVLKPGGSFVAKVFQGGAQNTLLAEMKRDFKTIKHIKPPSSRKESSEQFLVAQGFRGG